MAPPPIWRFREMKRDEAGIDPVHRASIWHESPVLVEGHQSTIKRGIVHRGKTQTVSGIEPFL